MDDLKEAVFCFDGHTDTTFPGYTNGDTWNGWACPYFERDIAEQVAEYWMEIHEDNPDEGFESEYDPRRDAFLFHEPVHDEPLIFESTEVEGKRLYAVGAYHWTWVKQ